jgi:hypothetical protein
VVTAALQPGGTENITTVSTATNQTLDTLARDRILYSVGGLARSADGDVYFADYTSAGVSYVSKTGIVKLAASGGMDPAVSSDDRYLAVYAGALFSPGTGPGSSARVVVIDRRSGNSRSIDLSKIVGPDYVVTSLAWLAGRDRLVVDAEILVPASGGAACPLKTSNSGATTRGCDQQPPPPARPRLVILDATSPVVSNEVLDISATWTLVGPGPNPGTVVAQDNSGGRSVRLLVLEIGTQTLHQTTLAVLPAGAATQSLDPAGRYLLYLRGYQLEYGIISDGAVTAVHVVPGKYAAATWSP